MYYLELRNNHRKVWQSCQYNCISSASFCGAVSKVLIVILRENTEKLRAASNFVMKIRALIDWDETKFCGWPFISYQLTFSLTGHSVELKICLKRIWSEQRRNQLVPSSVGFLIYQLCSSKAPPLFYLNNVTNNLARSF